MCRNVIEDFKHTLDVANLHPNRAMRACCVNNFANNVSIYVQMIYTYINIHTYLL